MTKACTNGPTFFEAFSCRQASITAKFWTGQLEYSSQFCLYLGMFTPSIGATSSFTTSGDLRPPVRSSAAAGDRRPQRTPCARGLLGGVADVEKLKPEDPRRKRFLQHQKPVRICRTWQDLGTNKLICMPKERNETLSRHVQRKYRIGKPFSTY